MCCGLSRYPDLAQQRRLLARLAGLQPRGRRPTLHSDMDWRYQHYWWHGELICLGIIQSMSKKGKCLDNGTTEQELPKQMPQGLTVS